MRSVIRLNGPRSGKLGTRRPNGLSAASARFLIALITVRNDHVDSLHGAGGEAFCEPSARPTPVQAQHLLKWPADRGKAARSAVSFLVTTRAPENVGRR
jgi:hypothetical protein